MILKLTSEDSALLLWVCTRTDIGNHGLDLAGGFVSERQHDGVDSAVGGESPYRCFSSLGRAGLGLQPVFGVGQTQVPTPPVVNQGHRPGA